MGAVSGSFSGRVRAQSVQSESTNLTPDERSFQFEGRIFSNGYASISPEKSGQFEQWILGTWFTGIHQVPHSKWKARWTLDARVGALQNLRSDRIQAVAREAELEYRSAGLRIKIGQWISPWGKLDGVQLTDPLTSRNDQELNWDDEVRRVGIQGLSFTYSPREGQSPFEIQWVFAPRSPKNLLYFPSRWALAESAESSSSELNWGNTFQALRLTFRGESFDLSGIAVRRQAQTPFVELSPDALSRLQAGEAASVSLHHLKESALGLEGSWSLPGFLDAWVLKGEALYTFTEKRTNQWSEPDSLQGAIAVERGWNETWRLQIQSYFKNYVTDVASPGTVTGQLGEFGLTLDQLNRLMRTADERFRFFQTLRFAYETESSDWLGEIFVLGSWTTGDGILRPLMGYRLSDAFRLTGGVQAAFGPLDRTLGLMRERNSVFLEGRFLF